MMDNLRTAANGPVLKIVLALIILTFLLTGVTGYLSSESGSYAAKVNGQTISRAELEQAFLQEKDVLQERLGDQFSALLSDEQQVRQIRRQSLDRLINTVLIEQYANKLGLSASDDQVAEEIRNTSFLQTDGKFDNKKYQDYLNMLARSNISPDHFAAQVRKELINRQLMQVLMGSEIALPTEIKQEVMLILQERTVRFATLELKSLEAQQKVTDEELKNYYSANSKRFTVPEKVKISYIKMDAVDELKNITVSEADIEKYYKNNLSKYTTPEQKKYSFIQLVSDSAAKSVLDELNKGADFSQLAAEKSTDKFSAQKGGDLGWMEESSLPNELKSANLTQKGQLSEIVKLSNAYAIFRLDDIKPQVIKPLADIHAEIEKIVKQEKSVDAFYDLQRKVSDAAANDNESLAAAEKAAGYAAVNTDWFDRDHIPADINFSQVVQAIFSGNLIDDKGATGTNSDVISVEGDRAFIVRVNDVKPETVQPFGQAKSEMTELLKRQKAEKQLQVESEKLLVALKEGKGEQALKAAGIQFGQPTVIKRFPQTHQATDIAFTLPHPKEGKVQYGLAQDEIGNAVLIQLDKVIPGSISDEQIKQYQEGYQYQTGNMMLESLMINLRDEADIKFGQVE
ncbi:peptidylprolyl isomerase [Xenorhabdus nematophila]|uniref:peptidylprolyl isomerase n=1 Tax=Xenorhabdus nematophila TaxID=628 RepID=UPI00032754B4|nr:peptidylprolyl isomerase [Xenorhabdus nematophila]CEF31220.1 peptidyl-prolyl cis-trans isomerase, for periplasmic folding of outer membrane proteins [Xenorhabdus nematophila str. Websteri]AYA40964.1 peptidylprolyl isomerase [Xenorhabdus nematophila]MBA0019710.1 peptidylprolyl isomerase [Xenorhabdus nematophila]MCB4426613.1 peptidylprolyl isomerase [Xenorhabdus nematophila]QNJ35373.1 peptidylprolyl isomerase [Xenorhabdus nematophila]